MTSSRSLCYLHLASLACLVSIGGLFASLVFLGSSRAWSQAESLCLLAIGILLPCTGGLLLALRYRLKLQILGIIEKQNQATRELEKEKAALKMLTRVVQQTADSVLVTNREGCIEYVNPAFEKQTGYTFSEIQGQTPRILKSGRHSPAFYSELWKQILAGEPFSEVIINRIKDGSISYEEKTITPLRDAQGNITHFVATSKDITQRRIREEREHEVEAQFRAIYEHAGLGIALLDSQGTIKLCNKAWECLFDLPQRGALDQSLFKFLTVAGSKTLQQLFRGLSEGEVDTVAIETEFLSQNGRPLFGAITLTLIRDADKRPLRSIAIIEDTTNKRLLAQEREAILAALDMRVRELGCLYHIGNILRDDTRLFDDTLLLQLADVLEAELDRNGIDAARISYDRMFSGSEHWPVSVAPQISAHFSIEGASSGAIEIITSPGLSSEELSSLRDVAESLAGLLKSSLTRRFALEHLVRSESIFRRMCEASPIALVEVEGTEGTVRYANGRFKELFGYTRQDIPDVAHWWPLAYPDFIERERVQAQWVNRINEATASGNPLVPMEAIVTCKDGSRKSIEFHGASFKNLSIIFFIDLTAHRKQEESLRKIQADLEQRVAARTLELRRSNYAMMLEISERSAAEARLKAITAALPDGAFIIESTGRIETVISSFSPIPGRSVETLPGRNILHLLPIDAAQLFQKAIEMTLEDGTVHFIEYEIMNGEETCYFEARTAPLMLAEGGRKFIVTIIRDITQKKEADKRLFESRQMIQLILDLIPQRICWKDLSGTYLGCNNAFARDAHLDSALAVVGLSDHDMPWARNAEYIEQRDKLVMDTGASLLGSEEKFLTPEGVAVWTNASRIPIRDQESKVIGILDLFEDVTARKLAQEELLRAKDFAERLIETANVMVLCLDSQGRTVVFNKTAERITGYSRNEILGRIWFEFAAPSKQRQQLQEFQTRLRSSEPIPRTLEYPILRKDGDERTILWQNSSTSGPESTITCVCFGIDVTRERKISLQLKSTLYELERSNRDLEQFASIASHDLQEPLRLVNSYVQLLAERCEGKLGKEAEEFIGYAISGTNRMQTLIQDLLAYSRVGQKALPHQKIDTNALLAEVLSTLKLTLRDSNASVSSDQLPPIQGDSTLISQLFQNLIANSIKFHGEHPPAVHIFATQASAPGFWKFAVRDNGIGIDPEFHQRVFEIFQRLHSRKKYPGSGIGLAICQKIVELHGGAIWVESALGKGTTFFFTLPALHSGKP